MTLTVANRQKLLFTGSLAKGKASARMAAIHVPDDPPQMQHRPLARPTGAMPMKIIVCASQAESLSKDQENTLRRMIYEAVKKHGRPGTVRDGEEYTVNEAYRNNGSIYLTCESRKWQYQSVLAVRKDCLHNRHPMRSTILAVLAASVLISGKAAAELPTHPDDVWGDNMDYLVPPQDMDCYNPDSDLSEGESTSLLERLAQTVAVWHRFARDTGKYEEWLCDGFRLGEDYRPTTLPQSYQARPGPSPRWLTLEEGGGFVRESDLDGSGIMHFDGQPWEKFNWRRELVFSGVSSQEWVVWPYACKEVVAREIEALLHLQCRTINIIKQRYRSALGGLVMGQMSDLLADDLQARIRDTYLQNLDEQVGNMAWPAD